MSASKKQKTVHDSGIYIESDSEDSAFESAHPHKNDKKKDRNQKDSKQKLGDTTEPAPHDYICIHRPFFDVEGENWLSWSKNPSAHMEKSEIWSKLYKPIFDQEVKDGIYKAPPEQHKEHKWVMMWDAWLKKDVLDRKAKYCDPDNFGMYLYNDWRGWGMQEIGENMMIEFDQAIQKKGDNALEKMWTVISAVGLWLNTDDNIGAFINTDDGETACELIGLLGCSFLTTLAAVESAGELKPDSKFIDLPLVIAYYLELSHDLPAFGIEGECVTWRREAVRYFKKGKLDPSKGLFATKLRIEKLEKVSNYDEDPAEENIETEEEDAGTGDTAQNPVVIPEDDDADKENEDPDAAGKKTVSPSPAKGKRKRGSGDTEAEEKDPWKWAEKFKAYKHRQHPKLGGTHYDITKMSRKDRAAAAFDKKDPLADVSTKDLKENLLDFA